MEGISHSGRTQLGVGEHDHMKKILEEERHKECLDHMRTKEVERLEKQMIYGEPHASSCSMADIGYETSMCQARQRKQLNDARRAEYEEHLAAQSTPSHTAHKDNSTISTQTPSAQQQDESTNTLHMGPQSDNDKLDDHRQKQRDYGDALREQIAEKKRNTERCKRRDREEDESNFEMNRVCDNNFMFGSNSR